MSALYTEAHLQLVSGQFVVRKVPSLSLSLEKPRASSYTRNRLLPVDGLSLSAMEIDIIATTVSWYEYLDGEKGHSKLMLFLVL